MRFSQRVFEIMQPGNYRLTVTGLDDPSAADQHALVVTHNWGGRMGVIIVAIVFSAIGMLAGNSAFDCSLSHKFSLMPLFHVRLPSQASAPVGVPSLEDAIQTALPAGCSWTGIGHALPEDLARHVLATEHGTTSWIAPTPRRNAGLRQLDVQIPTAAWG